MQSEYFIHGSNMATRPLLSLEQEEAMLKKKAAFLEEFLKTGGMEPRAVEDRVQLLQERIKTLEVELSRSGNFALRLQSDV